MNMLSGFAILVVCISMSNCFLHDLPTYFPRCYIDDPELNKCLLNAFNTVRPYVRKGVEEIGIIPFEPVVLSLINVTEEFGPVNGTFIAWDYTIRGLDNYTVNEISYDPKTLFFSIKMEFNALQISTFYNISGCISETPLEGKGLSETTLGPINVTIEIKGKLIEVEAVEYYNTTELKVIASIADGTYKLEGLFGDDEECGNVANNFINSYSFEIVQATTPIIERLAEGYFMEFMKSFTGSVPYNKIFPKSHN